MKKLIGVLVFAVVCLFTAPAFAQEVIEGSIDIEELSVEDAAPDEETAPVDEIAQKLMDGGLVVEKGANANININRPVLNVPDEVDANVTGSIDVAGRLKVERADMTFCERHHGLCTGLAIGGGIVGASAVIFGGLYIAKENGLLDSSHTVTYVP